MRKLETKNIEEIFALTPMQEGMLFHYLKDPLGEQGDEYFEQLDLGLFGEIDKEIFKQAWNLVIAANEILRVVFRWEKMNEPVQMVMNENRVELRFFDLSMGKSDFEEKQKRLEELKGLDRREKFDLQQTPFRITLCKTEPQHYDMIISHHHILYDGWSNGILLKEFFNAYHELSQGKMPLPVIKSKFKEFVKYTRGQLDSEEHKKFWQGYLNDFEEPAKLPFKAANNTKTPEMVNWQFHIPSDMNNKLQILVQDYKITPAVVFYSVWGLLLQGYNDCEEVLFGTTVSGRIPAIKDIEEMVGLFINTLPLRMHLQPGKELKNLLFEVQNDLQQKEKFSSTPLVRLKEYCKIDVRRELFDTLMVVENYPLDPALKNGSLGTKIVSYSQSAMTHYDLTAAVTLAEQIEIIFSYPAALFEQIMIERMAGHFLCILAEALENPAKKIGDIERLTSTEKQLLLDEFNDTTVEFPFDKTIQQLFEEQVLKTPDHIAVIGHGLTKEEEKKKRREEEKNGGVETLRATSLQITYLQLNEQSNQLAGLLSGKGVQPGTIVGIMIERSIEMIIGILGILKAGGAYLPIDPSYPVERIQYMLKDSQTRILLTKEDCQGEIIVNDQLSIVNCQLKSRETASFRPPLFNIQQSRHLAYVIYTSGTIGKPKGVMVEHRNVIRLVKNTNYIEFKANDRILQTGALEFDASTFEIWGALLNGLMFLLIKKEEVLSPKKLYENLIKYDISIMWLTSSLFNHLLEADIKIFSVLRHLLVGGESLSTRHINKLRARFAHLNIINGYGPTENTTFSTTFRIDKEYEENIPIGKPIANSTAFIINNWHGIQPIGAIGELYVGGYGVARGYLNNPELTADKFKPLITQMEQMTQMKNKNNALGANFQHSALIIQHSNLYCTGDLVRWLEDGNIEFLGRIDRQVKIRGFRIEPGEIERHILVYKDIKEAVVIDNLVNEEKSLCAYIVNQKEKGIDISKLRQYLSNLMPDFMIPAYFITIDKLPLTANGKINRQALPKPEIKPLEQFISYRNKTEELLAEIWSNILGLEKEKIGIDDNFFSCGGHSLKAIQLSGKIHKHFDLKISITAIFNNPTIRALAEYIESKKTITTIRDFVPLEAIEKKTYYELSAGQQNIYLFQQMYPNSTAYHISSAIEPTGEANPAVLREIFKKMILRHESLRTSFIQVEGKPFQRVHDQVEFDLEILGDRDQKAGVTAFIRPFDLSRAPLLRVGLLKKQDGGTILLIDIHHIIADGTSVDILTREFETFQAGSQLPFPAIQYKDFCLWQDRICQREEMKTHERYWLELLKAPLPLLQLATDFPRFEEQNLDGDSIHYALGKELTQEIYEYLKETNATLYMLLLTVFNILLHRYTGQEDIIISSPFAGRDHDDLENVVGLLIGALPMRNFPREYKTFSQFLEEIKKSTLQAYENRWYPYEEILRKVDYPKHTGHTPISDISLLVQNTGIGNGSREQQFSRLAFYEELFPKNSKVDMTLIIEEKAGDIFLSLEYRAGLFKRESMERLVRHLVNVLQNGIADPGIYLSHIEMLTPHEKQQISGTFNSYYPLSHAQKRIYYMDKRYVGAPVANLGTVFRYAQVLDMNLLEIAINKVIEKNDALRLRIIESPFEKEPIQYVVPFERQAIEFIDFSRNGNDNERRVQECVNALSAAPFDTLNGPLYYFAMLKFNEKETGFYLKNHHIIADGWAVCTLLVNQIDQIYEELYSGKIGKESTYFSYLDYLTDEKKYLASKQVEIDKTYWYNLLLPLPSPVRLSDRENNDFNVKSGSSEFILPHILIQEIYAYIESTGKITSIFKLLFSVFSIYISRITGLDDFVIGSACHNRVDDRQKQTIGMFAGTIPIRVEVPGDQFFYNIVEKNGNLINTIIKNHQQYPFDLLALRLGEETGVDLNYLLDINFISVSDSRSERYQIIPYVSGYDPNQLTIYLFYNHRSNTLKLEWIYRENFFTPSEISRMHNSMMVILRDALQHPNKKIRELEVLSCQEKQKILEDFNSNILTTFPYPQGITLHDVFSQQVEKVTGQVAVLDAEARHHVTYNQVDEKANHLAFSLQENSVKTGDIVAVTMGPSAERIIVLLGILKSGAAYLPIDPQCPQERIDYMLKDSNARILITNDEKKRDNCQCSIVNCQLSMSEPRASLQQSNRLAYVIYTSGSTGRPKGVVVSHRNVLAYLAAFANEIQLNESDIVIQQASYTFDAFIEEMYPILLKGGKLVVPSRETIRDIHLLVDFIARYRVSMITCSPLLLDQLNNLDSHEALHSIHTFISGGDVLHERFIDKLLKVGKVYNTYGPTESTVCITYYRFPGKIAGNVPIGKPIANYKVYILDKNMQMVPLGVPGELCVSGPGVSQGYLNKPELTAEKFRPLITQMAQMTQMKNISSALRADFHHSAFIIQHSILYSTGDLACWLEDGNIEFLGRIDEQVKIRGFRIELGEIENHLRRYEGIKDAIVIVAGEESADKFLCAYIVSEKPLKAPALEKYLFSRLPDYMIPRNFVSIERIPMTANGKVDRKSLPAPSESEAGILYAAPRNEYEEKLTAIWAEVLVKHTPASIGIDDDFFKLGGHSLKAAIIISKIHKILNVKISLAELFHKPTIRQLAEVVRGSTKDYLASLAAVEEKEYYFLSSAQERLYILQQLEPTSTAYNIPHVLKLAGIIDREKLACIFKELIRRHESFRTSFITIADEPVQRIQPEIDFIIEYFDLAAGKLPQHEQTQIFLDKVGHFSRAFDLSRAPLLRGGLVKLAEQEHVLILDMHHIIADGTSMGILTGEAMALYNNEILPDLKIRYRDYVAWQENWKKSPSFKEQEAFWYAQFEDEIPVLNLPFDRPRPKIQRFEGKSVFFEFDQVRTGALYHFARREGMTLYMVLLAIFNVFLHKLSNCKDIVIGSPVEGRRHVDLQRIIGMFVNTLALRNHPEGDKPFLEFLTELKKRTISAFENQEYPFEDLVVRLDVPRDLSRNPVFDVMFVLQNMETPPIQLPGLTISSSPFENNTAKFDLILTALDKEQKLQLSFEYSSVLFEKDTIIRFAEYFKNIIAGILEKPGQKISTIEIISAEEKRIILHDFNNTETPYRRDTCIHELFEEQAARTPDRIAITARETREKHEKHVETLHATSLQITYLQLNEQSARLAGLLIEKGIAADDIIGIMIERSIAMMIGIYGILKAGSAYLPIDPHYPQERIAYMLMESAAKMLLTAHEIEYFSKECVFNFHHSAFITQHSNHLCYVIYTSGTTGKPKGAAIEHHSLVNRLSWMQKQYPLNANDIILHKTPFTFDVSVWEIFWWGMVGAGVYLLTPGGEKNPQEILTAISTIHVNVMHFVPSMLGAFLEYIENPGFSGPLPSLKQIITSGEALTAPMVKRFNELLNKKNNIPLANLYGPTEATIDVSYFDCPIDCEIDIVPIGKPIDNINLYICSSDAQLQPVGVPGELYISGVGLARGYLNKPELTANLFNRSYGSYKTYILYKTGDLARWLPGGPPAGGASGGVIEYLGRIDQQVKIRGFRIELAEIEQCLENHKHIKTAVVIVESDSKANNALCAYIVPETREELQAKELKEHLSQHLPAYMIPAFFKHLDRIPLTPNGKIDRKKLQSLGSRLDDKRKSQYTVPGTPTEIKIACAWKEMIRLTINEDEISIHDNFFDIGGTSMDVIRVNSRINREFNKQIPIVAMYKYTTIHMLAQFLEKEEKNIAADYPANERIDKIERGKTDKNKMREMRRKGR